MGDFSVTMKDPLKSKLLYLDFLQGKVDKLKNAPTFLDIKKDFRRAVEHQEAICNQYQALQHEDDEDYVNMEELYQKLDEACAATHLLEIAYSQFSSEQDNVQREIEELKDSVMVEFDQEIRQGRVHCRGRDDVVAVKALSSLVGFAAEVCVYEGQDNYFVELAAENLNLGVTLIHASMQSRECIQYLADLEKDDELRMKLETRLKESPW